MSLRICQFQNRPKVKERNALPVFGSISFNVLCHISAGTEMPEVQRRGSHLNDTLSSSIGLMNQQRKWLALD